MLTVVGVGPGDPGLITLAALRALRSADRILMVDTQKDSAIHHVIRPYIGTTPIELVHLPMRGTRDMWTPFHVQTANQLRPYLQAGEHLVWPILGDPSLYASSSYILPLLKEFPHKIIPGVPAMCAAAAELQLPLAQGRECLTVLGGYTSGEILPRGNVVVMKAGKGLRALKSALQGRPARFTAKLGRPDFSMGDLSELDEENVHYFTTVLIKEKEISE